jgi:hypothetical protein
MSLLGLAIIGKRNEPLFLCDTTRFQKGDAAAAVASPEATPEDCFGFVDAVRAHGLRDSLPLEHQFMMHAALDRLEEVTGAASRKGSMVGVNMTVVSSSPHWMGSLMTADDSHTVYGYVTATNVKFLALVTKTSKDVIVKDFLTAVHVHFISHLLNPFADIKGPINSRKFDENIKAAVADYEKAMP